MNIKIISDGTSMGTKLINLETGKIIANCYGVSINIKAPDLCECTLTLRDIPFEISKIPAECEFISYE